METTIQPKHPDWPETLWLLNTLLGYAHQLHREQEPGTPLAREVLQTIRATEQVLRQAGDAATPAHRLETLRPELQRLLEQGVVTYSEGWEAEKDRILGILEDVEQEQRNQLPLMSKLVPTAFAEHNCVYTSEDPTIAPIPVLRVAEGLFMCFQMTGKQLRILQQNGGRVWFHQFSDTLRPMALFLDYPLQDLRYLPPTSGTDPE